MKKMQAYQYLSRQGVTLSFIANCILTSGGMNCAKYLKALAILHQNGHEFDCVSFTMPTEMVLMDGKSVTLAEVLTKYLELSDKEDKVY